MPKIPGTILLWVYSCFANRFLSSLLAISPAWGRPYMPLGISAYTLPSIVAFPCRLYSFIILSGMLHSVSLRYSYCVMGVFR